MSRVLRFLLLSVARVKQVSLVVLLLAVTAVTVSARPTAPAAATRDACALPAKKPVWIDFADGSVPFWEQFAHPGIVAAASNFIFPPQLRARGAKTVYFDLNLTRRTGSPAEPADGGERAPGRRHADSVEPRQCPISRERPDLPAHARRPRREARAARLEP